jgi:VanZ family protein
MSGESSSRSVRHPKNPPGPPQGGPHPSLLTRREGRAAALVVAALVLVIALIPGTSGPPTLIGWDKLDHAAAFAALTLLCRCGWPRLARAGLALVVFGYGAGIELAQATAAVGRVASVSDAVANASGIAAGLVLSWGLARIGAAAPILNRRR